MWSIARTRSLQRHIEWALLSAALLGLVGWLGTSLDRVNHIVQDAGLRWVARPTPANIVIVAIDDASIAAIGRWPWRRALHAELISRISAQQPLALGMDVLFNEEDLDYPQDDVLLADALSRSGRVVLPVLQRGHGPAADSSDLPWHTFADAAAGLGHVYVAPDADGVVRSLYLSEGPAAAPWRHFSLALLCVAEPSDSPCSTREPAAQPGQALPPSVQGNAWQRTDRRLIAYGGGPGHFTTYSYIDVLKGQVPPTAFQGKYVLVGAAASGLGDMFATPVSHESRLMPGVEVVAHVLDARLSGVHIEPASPALNTAFNLVPVAVALVVLLLAGPLAGLLTCAGLAAATLLLSLMLPAWAGLQFAPAGALAGLALAYPLWSWRRLSAAAHFLRLELDRLQREGLSLRLPDGTSDSRDFLEKRINAVERASRHLRDLHHFVSESLQQLPTPILVCDPQGRILLTNAAARRHLGIMHPTTTLQGESVVELLHDLVLPGTEQPLITHDTLRNRSLPRHTEARDAQERSLLVQCSPFTDLAQAGWLLTLVDLTEMRRAQLQRDQALNFISHDIRAPNASILTLLEMQRAYPGHIDCAELVQRIERYAHKSLSMAESFVQLASAESQEYRREPVDLVALLAEAVDDLWALAKEHEVALVVTHAPEAANTLGDRGLLSRAVTNILHNAVKFSPTGGTVRCAILDQGEYWAVSVRDEGPGIAAEKQDQLFGPFKRLHERSHPGIAGVGLGLALVRTVVERHGGVLQVNSEVGQGAEFVLLLPVHA